MKLGYMFTALAFTLLSTSFNVKAEDSRLDLEKFNVEAKDNGVVAWVDAYDSKGEKNYLGEIVFELETPNPKSEDLTIKIEKEEKTIGDAKDKVLNINAYDKDGNKKHWHGRVRIHSAK